MTTINADNKITQLVAVRYVRTLFFLQNRNRDNLYFCASVHVISTNLIKLFGSDAELLSPFKWNRSEESWTLRNGDCVARQLL